jgi:hypothetical protein
MSVKTELKIGGGKTINHRVIWRLDREMGKAKPLTTEMA